MSKERNVLTFVYSLRGQVRHLKTVLADFTEPTGHVCRVGTALHAVGALASQGCAPQREARPECSTQTRPRPAPAVATSCRGDADSGQNGPVLRSGEAAFLPGTLIPTQSPPPSRGHEPAKDDEKIAHARRSGAGSCSPHFPQSLQASGPAKLNVSACMQPWHLAVFLGSRRLAVTSAFPQRCPEPSEKTQMSTSSHSWSWNCSGLQSGLCPRLALLLRLHHPDALVGHNMFSGKVMS